MGAVWAKSNKRSGSANQRTGGPVEETRKKKASGTAGFAKKGFRSFPKVCWGKGLKEMAGSHQSCSASAHRGEKNHEATRVPSRRGRGASGFFSGESLLSQKQAAEGGVPSWGKKYGSFEL